MQKGGPPLQRSHPALGPLERQTTAPAYVSQQVSKLRNPMSPTETSLGISPQAMLLSPLGLSSIHGVTRVK